MILIFSLVKLTLWHAISSSFTIAVQYFYCHFLFGFWGFMSVSSTEVQNYCQMEKQIILQSPYFPCLWQWQDFINMCTYSMHELLSHLSGLCLKNSQVQNWGHRSKQTSFLKKNNLSSYSMFRDTVFEFLVQVSAKLQNQSLCIKQSRNRPSVALRVPGGLSSQIFKTLGTWRW